jgi:hypothetical protein
MSQGATEGVQTEFNTAPTTNPESWQESVGDHGPYPMPGTQTQKLGPEHPNAREQEYYLQDEADPVKKGEHTRNVLPH